MNFSPTPIEGAYLVELRPFTDERGYFARTWSRRELPDLGLVGELPECSLSYNRRRGTQPASASAWSRSIDG